MILEVIPNRGQAGISLAHGRFKPLTRMRNCSTNARSPRLLPAPDLAGSPTAPALFSAAYIRPAPAPVGPWAL